MNGGNLPVSDLPREDAVVVVTVLLDATLDVGAERVFRPGPSDHSGADAARLLVAVEDLGHAAVGHSQLTGDDTRPDTGGGQFDDLEADVIGQRAAVDEHSAQLIDAALT